MITRRQLEALPEAQLAYPGSVLLDEQGANEGEGHGFDNLDPSPMIHRLRGVKVRHDEIVAWYSAELRRMGWTGSFHMDPYQTTPWGTFTRGRELIDVTVMEKSRPGSPPGRWDEYETVYGVTYTIRAS